MSRCNDRGLAWKSAVVLIAQAWHQIGSDNTHEGEHLPYNRTDDQWEHLIEVGLDYLKTVAQREGQESYTDLNVELATETGQPQFDFRNPGDVAGMSHLLANISERGREMHPTFLITAIITGKKTGEPGPGFYTLGQNTGLLKPEENKETFWVKQTIAAYAYYSKKRDRP